jgi:lysophospholipase L1-like esterase
MATPTKPQYRTYVSDPYIWFERHSQVVEENRKRNPQVILIGDSITHYWGGVPTSSIQRGSDSYDELYGRYDTVNMGFGFDGTEHVLWRLQNGELDNISPKVAQVLIGANNLRACSDEEIFEGVRAVVSEIHLRLPNTKILLLGILPHHAYPKREISVNRLIAKLDGAFDGLVHFADPGAKVFADAAGNQNKDLYGDGCHPNAEGNRRFAQEIRPHLEALLRD